MNFKRWPLIPVALVLGGLLVLGLSFQKTVTLEINGEAVEVTTSALTVGTLLESAEIPLYPGDQLTPRVEHWLRNDEVIRIERAVSVTIETPEGETSLRSVERSVDLLLRSAEIPVGANDRLIIDGESASVKSSLSPDTAHTIQVRRAVPVRITIGAQEQSIQSSASTVGGALWEAGVSLNAADHVEPALDTPLVEPLEVFITPSQPITIKSPEGDFEIKTTASTVGEALTQAGSPLQGLDYSVPAPDQPLPTNGVIRVVRVEETVELETEPLPFESEFQPSDQLELDTQDVIQAGRFGLTARRVRVRYENGEQVQRQVEAEYIAQEPQNQIVGYGTKVVPHTLEVPGGTITYWRKVSMYATSYSPCRIFDDRCDDVTASGARLRRGVAAVTLDWYRLIGGTQVYVPGYGAATIADVGGGIPGRYWIDLGYSDEDYVSWHNWTTVYFLWPPPPTIQYILN